MTFRCMSCGTALLPDIYGLADCDNADCEKYKSDKEVTEITNDEVKCSKCSSAVKLVIKYVEGPYVYRCTNCYERISEKGLKR